MRHTSDPAADRPDPRRLSWAELLQRIFDVDALCCPGCGARMRLVAAIEDPEVAHKILACLDLPARAPPLAPATDEPAELGLGHDPEFLSDEPAWAFDQTPPPVHHTYHGATGAFQALYSHDMVYVGTAYCSTTTENRIYGVDANAGSMNWSFNAGATADMDWIWGMVLDEGNDVLYVTTDRRDSGTQHSVWAIDVLTGAKIWSVSAGPLWTPPSLRGNRLYVADIHGNLRAIDTATGSIVWTLSNGGWPFLTNVEVATVAPNDDLVVAVGINATGTGIWAARDNGVSGSWAWDETIPVLEADYKIPMHVDSEGGTVQVGAEDGKLYELDLATGNVVTTRTVDADENSVDALAIHRPAGTSELWLVAGSSGGELVKFCAGVASAVPSLGLASLGALILLLLVATLAATEEGRRRFRVP